MASTPSTLTDLHKELAIDASVLINVLGTGEPDTVLSALARPVIIASAAHREVTRDPYTSTMASDTLDTLQAQGLLVRCDLDAIATQHMVALVAAPGPDGLDDGEAATIALAARRGCSAVIDEARGRRIAASVPIDAGTLGTLDILACESVQRALGKERFRAAILSAARVARMRIPLELGPWAEALLSEPVARDLPGLRGYYRSRR